LTFRPIQTIQLGSSNGKLLSTAILVRDSARTAVAIYSASKSSNIKIILGEQFPWAWCSHVEDGGDFVLCMFALSSFSKQLWPMGSWPKTATNDEFDI
jgi:hypothetical protein